MEDGPPGFRRGSTCPDVLGYLTQGAGSGFAYGSVTLYGETFQCSSASVPVDNSPRGLPSPPIRPRNPGHATPAGLHMTGLGCSPFARRYWGNLA